MNVQSTIFFFPRDPLPNTYTPVLKMVVMGVVNKSLYSYASVGTKSLFHNLAGAKESMIIAANVAVIMGCYPCFTDEEIWGSEMLNNLLVITQVERA